MDPPGGCRCRTLVTVRMLLAKLLERGGAGGDQDAARPGPQVPGMHAVHQLHRNRQMCPSHHCLHQKPTGRGPRVAQVCGTCSWLTVPPAARRGTLRSGLLSLRGIRSAAPCTQAPGGCGFGAPKGEVGRRSDRDRHLQDLAAVDRPSWMPGRLSSGGQRPLRRRIDKDSIVSHNCGHECGAVADRPRSSIGVRRPGGTPA